MRKTLVSLRRVRVHNGKAVRLSEEAYERLEARRREDETFSELVFRLTEERSLLELAGILTDEEADVLREAIEERRKRRRGELEAIAEQMNDIRQSCERRGD